MAPTMSTEGTACGTTNAIPQPFALALFEATETLYIVASNMVYSVVTRSGLVTRVVGVASEAGDVAGSLPQARLKAPCGIALHTGDTPPRVYIADKGNFKIKMVSLGVSAITVWAGTGVKATVPSNNVAPSAVAFDSLAQIQVYKGSLYVADYGMDILYRAIFSTNMFTVVCNPIKAEGVAVFRGAVYVALPLTNRIQECAIDDGEKTTLLNDGSGPGDIIGHAAAVLLKSPFRLSIDCLRRVLVISDSGNFKVKGYSFVTLLTSALAGSGTPGTPTTSEVTANAMPFGFPAETVAQNRTLWVCDNVSNVLVIAGLATPAGGYRCVETATRSPTATETLTETDTVSETHTDTESLSRSPKTHTQFLTDTVEGSSSESESQSDTVTSSATQAVSALDGTTADPTQTWERPSYTKSGTDTVTDTVSETQSLTLESERTQLTDTRTATDPTIAPEVNITVVDGNTSKSAR